MRLIVLHGSSADPMVVDDHFQDIDLLLLVNNSDDAVKQLLLCEPFKTAKLIRNSAKNIDHTEISIRAVSLEGEEVGVQIFEAFGSLKKRTNNFFKVLLDKDSVASNIPKNENRPFHVNKPTSQEFEELCLDIYWCLIDVMKGIGREQLIYAKHKHDSQLQPRLKTLLTWCVRDCHDWNVSLGSHGKRIRQYAAPDLYTEYLDTFSPNKIEEMPHSLEAARQFLSARGSELSASLEYSFPRELDLWVERYLTKRLRRGNV